MERDDVVSIVHEAIGKGTAADKLAELLADVAVETGLAKPAKQDKDKPKK